VAQIITTLGPKNEDELGMILPHEHVFVDLRTWDQPGYAQADTTHVVEIMTPEIGRAKNVGITALVECSTVGVGRRADIEKAVSLATDFPLVIPTGIYREPWIPQWAHDASEDYLYEWMLDELTGEIEHSGVQAGWIKLSAGDDGITECERKVFRAAVRAAKKTNAIIGSHTVRGSVAKDQLAIIEELGHTPERFIWIHAQAEEDFDFHLEIARRGAWIEYDWIGGDDQDDEPYISKIKHLLDADLGDKLLLSHDRGWYDPAQPNGGTPKPYTYINEHFLPKLRANDIGENTINQITRTNPFRAFAR
jgi:phosphotriesterase-related protein